MSGFLIYRFRNVLLPNFSFLKFPIAQYTLFPNYRFIMYRFSVYRFPVYRDSFVLITLDFILVIQHILYSTGDLLSRLQFLHRDLASLDADDGRRHRRSHRSFAGQRDRLHGRHVGTDVLLGFGEQVSSSLA